MRDNHYWEILGQIVATVVAIIVILNIVYGERMDRMNARLTKLEENYPTILQSVERTERGFERLLDILKLEPTYGQ